ncbi:hypothetical protein ABKN59_006146 [Abortiporus biennis]
MVSSPSILPLKINSSTPSSKTLRDELAKLIRGPVFVRPDSEFIERSRTFNGKLKSLATILVSPLDAQDIRRIREVDIEAPVPVEGEEGVFTWTSLKDMPAPGSKGKGRAGTIKVSTGKESNVVEGSTKATGGTLSDTKPEVPKVSSTKRRREDDGCPASSDVPPIMDDATLRSYDNASQVIASFLRGPPLPPIPGETPREPPLNRPRLHSPEPESEDITDSSTLQILPTLDERQHSNESSTSSESHSDSRLGSSSRDRGTPTTTPSGSVDGDKMTVPPPSGLSADPFGYMSSPTTSSRMPVYGGVNPLGPSSASTFPSFGTWSAPLSSSSNIPGPGPSSAPWSSSGFGFTGPSSSGVSSFSPNPPFHTALLSSFPPPSMSMAHMFGIGNPNPPSQPARPIHSHAYVTFGAGMRQKEIDTYTAEHPLEGISCVTGMREDGVVPYHIPSSAHPVGSSIMLLGGFGFLSRMYGLSIDNLVEIEMVMADGRILIVNKDVDPDLWWAVRGAGAAFGIATRYKVKAFPVPIVFAGNLVYRFHRATAPSLIKHFRDCIKGAPRELYANVLLTAGPADKDSLIVIQMCYVGPKEKGVEYLQAISSWDGERCLLNEVNEKSFLNQQDSVAQVLRGKSGRQWFIRSSLIHSLPDEVINQTILKFSNTPIGCTWIFELAGGAIHDFEDNCLPKEQREAAWTVAALHQWDMGIDDPRCITSAEDWMEHTIKTVSIGGPFPTFLGRHESASRTSACFGKNWDRLAELKKKYDPDGFLKNNFWPLDKDGGAVKPLYNEPPSP